MITTFDKASDAAEEAQFRANTEARSMAISVVGSRLGVSPLTDTKSHIEVVHPSQNLADHIAEVCRQVKEARDEEEFARLHMAEAVQKHEESSVKLAELLSLRNDILMRMENR